jgi:quinol monooxygenase YgiN
MWCTDPRLIELWTRRQRAPDPPAQPVRAAEWHADADSVTTRVGPRLLRVDDTPETNHAHLLLAEIHGLAGRQAELAALLEELAAASRHEPACEWFRVLRLNDPGEFVLLSMWTGDTALRDHYRTSHYERYRMQVGPLLARSSDVTLMPIGGVIHALDPDPPDPGLLG